MNIKKIIAREGLVIIGLIPLCVLFSFFHITIFRIIQELFPKPFYIDGKEYPALHFPIFGGYNLSYLFNMIFSYFFVIYCIYLLIRFIIWAIRTLKAE